MTKKDFKAIAEILKNSRYKVMSKEKLETINTIDLTGLLEDLSIYFENVNPNFDKEKFLTACLK